MKLRSARWVVKLGGSLGKGPHLRPWLDALRQHPLVIVPGGGVFADAVRQADRQWQFSDALAHRLAIESMGLYGRMLKGMCEALVPARTLTDLREGLCKNAPQIWCPEAEEVMRLGPQASWSVTSDTLSLWLAQQLGCEQVLLIKSRDVERPTVRLETLTSIGLVDPAFAGTLRQHPLAVWLAGPSDADLLEQGLRDPRRHFTRIVTKDAKASAHIVSED